MELFLMKNIISNMQKNANREDKIILLCDEIAQATSPLENFSISMVKAKYLI